MSQQVVDLKCPGCGNPVSSRDKTCIYCGNPVMITSFNSVADMSMPLLNKYVNSYRAGLAKEDNPEIQNAMGICYLKLKLYDKATSAFDSAIEENPDNSENYFYDAVSLLKGKKAYLSLRPVIDKIEEYIQAALSIEPRGIYYYFWAYIRYDYHKRKFFNVSPEYSEILLMAEEAGVSEYDKDMLYNMLNVNRPDCL